MTHVPLPFTHPPHTLLVEPIVRRALEEDLGRAGDLTSELTVPAERQANARLVARAAGTISGLIAAECAFRLIDPTVKFQIAIPGRYSVVNASGQVAGFLDGTACNGSRELASGLHEFEPAKPARHCVVIWAPAIEHGFSPFFRKSLMNEPKRGRTPNHDREDY